MIAGIARWLPRAFMACSLVGLTLTMHNIWIDPFWQPLVAASASEIRAQVETQLAAAATPEAMADRIFTRLDEKPRDWFVLNALHDIAVGRGIKLPPDLEARFETLSDLDNGWIAQTESCAICAVNVASCSLTQAMICAGPVQLSPVGDVIGIGDEASNYLMGQDVDLVNLSLSLVGLGATAAVVITGGTSESVQIGAGVLKIANGMGRLPKWIVVAAIDAARTGVKWDRLAQVHWISDLPSVIRADRFVRLAETAEDLNRVRKASDTTTALHLLKEIESPVEARKFADAAGALGKDIVGDGEILGKSRLLRATLRWSNRIVVFFTSLFSTLIALATGIGHSLTHLLSRRFHRSLRKAERSV